MDQEIINKEQKYLDKVQHILADQVQAIQDKLDNMATDMVQHRREIWENIGNMDEYEQSVQENAAELNGDRYVMLVKHRDRLTRQQDSPFFGKIVFGVRPDAKANFYIGLGQIDDADGMPCVVDWRAPVADLYYNGEVGAAQYAAPGGRISGEVYAKYQYKISGGKLQYMVDTQTTILDEVLMRELSQNASVQMRNIASTIQKEQNRIIRRPFGDNMLVQGVAGSGKTSIALHRIAYILYHSRSTIKPKEILIITPNKAFNGYIGNVLPELGEEMVPQTCMDSMAAAELRKLCEYETRNAHLEKVYADVKVTAAKAADLRYKASVEFAEDIQRFAALADKVSFRPRDFVARDYLCTKGTFEVLYYQRYAAYPSHVRMRKIVDYVEMEMRQHFHSKISPALHTRIFEMIMGMYTRYDALSLYRRMLSELADDGKPVMLPPKEGVLPYEDVWGVILLKCLIEGSNLSFKGIKHLFVDEMQDYTPVQYVYINKLFACPKTVLGDINQMADPFLNVGDEDTVRTLLGGEKCETFYLHTSYRSSSEITAFANRFSPTPIVPVERHDEEPIVARTADYKDMVQRIVQEINYAYDTRHFGSVAIICRYADQARRLRQALAPYHDVQLLLDADTPYRGGTVVTTAFTVKGFEFDQVILPDVDAHTYNGSWDKKLLYIQTTRALHRLCVLYTGEPSRYL